MCAYIYIYTHKVVASLQLELNLWRGYDFILYYIQCNTISYNTIQYNTLPYHTNPSCSGPPDIGVSESDGAATELSDVSRTSISMLA